MTAGNDAKLLERITRALATVGGVSAIVLGGSRARGTATEDSDYDVGLYYEPSAPLDIAGLKSTVAMLEERGGAAEVTAIGGWGPWINGGGWLAIAGTRVDLLYRDLGRVSLKALTTPYPAPLRDALTTRFIREAQFALENARHGSGRDDVHYVSGCCFRAIASLCQVIAAQNETYLLNEKGAVALADRLARTPSRFAPRVEWLYRQVGTGRLSEALDGLERLLKETAALKTG
jgi:predicted nucleotidyltransferase